LPTLSVGAIWRITGNVRQRGQRRVEHRDQFKRVDRPLPILRARITPEEFRADVTKEISTVAAAAKINAQ
jgi:hypothetical protein